ncbi:MAG: VOC family protein [Eggerthellaceae bacterium]|nr:VOC family protein [Eggerthellaceae bacterium]
MFFRQLTLMVRDLESSVGFYETMTELAITRRIKDGEADIAFLANQDGETTVELVCTPGTQKFEGKGFFVSFLTDKLDAMHDLAQAKGLNPSTIRNPDPQSRYFYVYDPDGVSVQLKQIM